MAMVVGWLMHAIVKVDYLKDEEELFQSSKCTFSWHKTQNLIANYYPQRLLEGERDSITEGNLLTFLVNASIHLEFC